LKNRVLFWLPPVRAETGGPRRVVLLASALQQRGWDSRIGSLDLRAIAGYAGEFGVDVLDGQWLGASGGRLAKTVGVARGVTPVSARARAVRRALNRWNPDLIVARNARGVLEVAHWARSRRLPIVWDVGIESRRRAARPAQWLASKLSARVVTQGKAALEDLPIGVTSSSACAILPGIDCRWQPRSHPGRRSTFTVAQVGSITPRKQQIIALQAFERFAALHDAPTRLWFIGAPADEDYARALEAAIARSSVAASVETLGWRADALDLVAQADVMVLPSLEEGVPNVVQEAMLIGTAVVATRVGGVPEVLADGDLGWLVSPGRVDEIVECLGRIASMPSASMIISQRAREYAASEFSLDGWARRYEAVLKEVLL
jgi:glycosyltransferase involved in cell wall biosynthesis